MKNSLKKAISLILCAVLLLALAAGCQSSSTPSGGTSPTPTPTNAPDNGTAAPETDEPAAALEPIDITFFLWGEKPNYMDEVLAEFHARTADTLNMNLSINWSPLDDFGNLINFKLAAGEPVDACFDAPWLNMSNFIAEGNYADLSGYFLNDKYPGLKAAFDENFLGNNTLGTGKTYGIPLTQAYGTAPIVFIRGDLRQKYGLPEITTPELYRQYLDAVVANEAQMIPYAASTSEYNTGKIFDNENALSGISMNAAGVYEYIYLAPEVYAAVYIEDYQVKAAHMMNEPESLWSEFPAPYNKRNIENALMAREFFDKGYLDKDFLAVSDSRAQFTSGKAASLYWDIANYTNIASALALSVPGATLEVYQPNPVYAQGLKGMVPGEYQCWNFVCIPITTPVEKIDRIMLFYDWMFQSMENHDLFELGIDGEHFISVGEDSYKMPEGVKPEDVYNFPGYQLTWNPGFIRVASDVAPDVAKYTMVGNDPATYYDPLLSGFSFLSDSVTGPLANPDMASFNSSRMNIEWGMVADVADAYAAMDAKTEANKNLMEDMALVKAEFIKQMQAYLDTRKVYDQENNIVYPQ